MRIFLWFSLLSLVGALPGDAHAQTREAMERCREIADDTRRLECYDAITLAPSTRSKYDVVPLDELLDFALSFRGDLVEVKGWLAPDDDIFALKLDAGAEDSIPVDAERLSRHALTALLDRCAEGCEATVQGRVAPVNFTTGIVADAIVVREEPAP